jgi:hypothetical protein
MSSSGAPVQEPESPLRVTVDGAGLVACLDALLAVPTPVAVVEVRVARSVGQAGTSVWLGFVTYEPGRGWERNGLAADAPGIGAGRSLVVDLVDLGHAVRAHVASSPVTRSTLEVDACRLTIGGRSLPALATVVPPVPDVPTVRDAVYLSGPGFGDVVVESEAGRVCLPRALVAHLHDRGARVAEFGIVDGDVYVVAQSERRGEASTDPVIIAPVEVVMWSEASTHAECRERRRESGGEVEQLLTALDPATPVPQLLALLDTGIAYVRRRVAAHPALPADVTQALAVTGTRPMRVAVAANPALGPPAVDILAQDPEATVRAELARNPVLTPAVRALLAADPDHRVRGAVAGDVLAAPELVRLLAGDPAARVCAAAVANPACPEDVMVAAVAVMPHAVLANPAAPVTLLTEQAHSVDGAQRAVVAANPSTPPRVLNALSRDPDARVLHAVATNPAAPAPARRRAVQRMTTDGEPIATPAGA